MKTFFSKGSTYYLILNLLKKISFRMRWWWRSTERVGVQGFLIFLYFLFGGLQIVLSLLELHSEGFNFIPLLADVLLGTNQF